MAWNYDKSKERIEKYQSGLDEITIEKLVREADLHSLLTETNCRTIYGAHTYIHVSNFARLASQKIDDEGEYKGVIRMAHIYQREVGHIVENIFGGVRIHFQGSKIHALFYRPIDNSEAIATKAILLELVVKDFVKNVFNPAFPDYDDFSVAGGSDIGDAIGTKNGMKGDRELLFLGAPANHAAKIIGSHGHLRVTTRVYQELPEDLKGLCSKKAEDEDVYQVDSVAQARLDELLVKYGIAWDRDDSKKRIADDKAKFPLDKIKYGSASTRIDIDSLGINNNKRVLAASVYGDVTGFTAYIDGANTEAQKKKRLKDFHVIRVEMARVVRDDFDGIRVQFQGDRVQAIFHLPEDDNAKIAEKAVDVAVALQSSMEKTLRACVTGIASLQMAVGVDMDTTLVTKLGTHAHRDRICLGEPVETAARCEERCDGGDIGITSRVYNELPDRLKKHFTYDSSKCCYVAADLTTDKVANAAKASAYGSGAAVTVTTGNAGTTVGIAQAGVSCGQVIVPPKPYAGLKHGTD